MTQSAPAPAGNMGQKCQCARAAGTGLQPRDPSVPRSGPIRMLRLAQVIDLTGLGKTKIYELQGEGRFPMRVKITAHAVGWVEDEVQAWLAQRVAASASLVTKEQRTLVRLSRR